MTPLTHPWVKSSYSSQDGGDCVEWSPAHAGAHGAVPVRDSKDPNGPALMFEPAAWSAFVAGVQAGDFPA
ncbi:uncharacterized protein DUF397 [Streptomyces sp. 2333.5]|uniref:DUF397 domain-containing protein n=1 Tax=unclassified Streptomyces TaxID=2593676 RepID=UPI00089992C5|nr:MULTISPECIES: DUF397 domain-containing protein [unclassified Streptomyces]PJJ05455.1 uncharacterized protein DUF397 [Streptomyces sp. 2333.5]SEE76299.1 protein of unknown function [Streptomyces sp. 2314.4]SEE99353.1 protein of unknown function [Streptomyces sp. 2112.2]